MPKLAFDTETTGLFDYKLELENPKQPRIIELGAVLFDEDEILEKYRALIKPDGWDVPDVITGLTGITLQQCIDEGVPIIEAIEKMEELASKASLSIAHNMSFDMAMYNRETVPIGMTRTQLRDLPRFCTMKRDERFKGKKLPRKLSELHRHLLGETHTGSHTALGDAEAAMNCYNKLMSLPYAQSNSHGDTTDRHGLKPLLF